MAKKIMPLDELENELRSNTSYVYEELLKTNKRIDTIVDAIDNAKRVKGL